MAIGRTWRCIPLKKKSIVVLVCLAAVLLLLTMFIIDSRSGDNKQPLLVEGQGVAITVERFHSYKANAELAATVSDFAVPSDEEILEELTATELSVAYARDKGLTATKEEIDSVIANERAALMDADSENELAAELMQRRIDKTGLTEEAFWSSEETRANYERAVLLGELAALLIDEGSIGDYFEFGNFQRELLERRRDNIRTDWSLLENDKTY